MHHWKQTMLFAATLRLLWKATTVSTCGKTSATSAAMLSELPVSLWSVSAGNSPSLESDWLKSLGRGTQLLGCSPGLFCAFCDLWRRSFLLETHHNISLVCCSVPKNDTSTFHHSFRLCGRTCVTRLATNFCEGSAWERTQQVVWANNRQTKKYAKTISFALIRALK